MSSPVADASPSGTNDSEVPKRPVLTVTHEGSPVASSRYNWPIPPILSPEEDNTLPLPFESACKSL